MKVGMLTSGGDCQGLNAAMRAVAKSLYDEFGSDVEIIGFLRGYAGLIDGKYRKMSKSDFSGILTLGGTILGTSRRPFKMMKVIEEDGVNKVEAMKNTYRKLKLDCLVILGGNGTHKTANLLSEEGLNVVTLPKTIDNDIYGTEISFGFQSACDIATNVIDCIHTTAYSHRRVFIVEVMGHKVGWLTLHAGISGGADVILLPEIPYDENVVASVIKKREADGKPFSIIAVAEGAISKKEAAMKKKEFKAYRESLGYPSVAYKLADELGRLTHYEIRCAVPGHFQRGGSPCSFDRVLCTRLGAAAARLIKQKKFGYMAAVQDGKMTEVPLSEVAGKLKVVDTDCDLIRSAREIGISFGE